MLSQSPARTLPLHCDQQQGGGSSDFNAVIQPRSRCCWPPAPTAAPWGDESRGVAGNVFREMDMARACSNSTVGDYY